MAKALNPLQADTEAQKLASAQEGDSLGDYTVGDLNTYMQLQSMVPRAQTPIANNVVQDTALDQIVNRSLNFDGRAQLMIDGRPGLSSFLSTDARGYVQLSNVLDGITLGSVTLSGTMTLAATGQIVGDATGITAAWQLGPGATFVLPRVTVAQRPGSPAIGQLEWLQALGLNGPEVWDSNTWIQLIQAPCSQSIYDELNRLGGFMPPGYTFPPECINTEFGPPAQDMRGAAIMVTRPVSVQSLYFWVSVAGVGAFSNFNGATLFQSTLAGTYTFLANTGASAGGGLMNSTGQKQLNWRNAGDTADQQQFLLPGVLYYAALTFGTYATSQPKIAGAQPSLSAVNNEINNAVNNPVRSWLVPSITAKRQTDVVFGTTAGLTSANFLPYFVLL